MGRFKIYEGVEGLRIDVALVDNEGEDIPVAVLASQKLFVRRPGSSSEEEWSATKVEPNIIRHTVPSGADLPAGSYKIQPYIETVDGFKGRGETVLDFEISKNFS